MKRVWNRALEGKTTAVVGTDAGSPPEDYPLVVVAVRCDLHEQPLAPLLEARDELARWLGWEGVLDEAPRRTTQASPRSGLLGDRAEPRLNDWILATFRELATEARGTVVLLFESVDFADPATLDALQRMVLRRGWLGVPLVLAFAGEPEGEAAELLRAVEQAEGPEGIVRFEIAPASEPPEDVAIPDVPTDVIRALRAAATIGATFESHQVASLLGIDGVEALELFQRARDAGVPLEDRGDGRFRWPRAWVDALRQSVLPSLAAAWHQRLAELIDDADEDQLAARKLRVIPPPTFTIRRAAPKAGVAEVEATSNPEAAPADRRARPPAPLPNASTAPAEAAPRAAGTLVPIEATPPTAAEIVADEEALSAFVGEPKRTARTSPTDARAARHLAEAGRHDAAIERYLVAAEDAAARGSNRLAIDYGREALKLLGKLPLTTRRRRLRIEILARLGRLQWEAAGPGSDFTLAEALRALEEARALVREDDPVHLAAGVRALIAGVCYDLGDPPSLERALSELTDASRELAAAGDARGAARLFNDQAAVWVRIGDPVRANHLLEESRGVFARLAADDAEARIELAETDHLIARLPLHVRPRPGRADDAVEMGLRHARDAERRYRELGATREVARVWETMGRLELHRGASAAAAEHLTRAVEVQSEVGDMIGLARSSAALAEVLAAGGRLADAIAVLGDSVELNSQKGSPLGLAYNRRALERFQSRLDATTRNTLAPELTRITTQLAEAEASFGRVHLED
ncbi:MAG: hypothetical protein U0610_21490 [bacterium]